MHFIYQINRLTTTEADSTYLCWLANNAQRICPVAGLERMTTVSVAKRLTTLTLSYYINSNTNSNRQKLSIINENTGTD